MGSPLVHSIIRVAEYLFFSCEPFFVFFRLIFFQMLTPGSYILELRERTI